jgi:hypothetical protein
MKLPEMLMYFTPERIRLVDGVKDGEILERVGMNGQLPAQLIRRSGVHFHLRPRAGGQLDSQRKINNFFMGFSVTAFAYAESDLRFPPRFIGARHNFMASESSRMWPSAGSQFQFPP